MMTNICRTAVMRRSGGSRSFLSRLRKARKERGHLLHYIYVTEGCNPGGRLHHHVVLNATGDDLEEIRRLWIYGDNLELRRLTFHRDYTYEDLASYLTKEPREWGHPQVGERTWTPSLGLAHPEPETETVPDCVTLSAPPEAGHPISGGSCGQRIWGVCVDQVSPAQGSGPETAAQQTETEKE